MYMLISLLNYLRTLTNLFESCLFSNYYIIIYIFVNDQNNYMVK